MTTTPATPASSTVLKVGRSERGYLVRVEGRGTLRESPAVMEFATRSLEGEPAELVIDLTGCEYLDSTFLGCLLTLYKKAGAKAGGRFTVAADAARRRKLLGPTRLDTVLKATDAPPPSVGPLVPLAAGEADPRILSRHVMECHRRLAEIEGPNQAAFRRIADAMAKELGEPPGQWG